MTTAVLLDFAMLAPAPSPNSAITELLFKALAANLISVAIVGVTSDGKMYFDASLPPAAAPSL